ncbi:hypothetical protein [Rugosimonospora africana]|uniref:Uncharacterized protein n=1 Tax=Rugosimonospora africana TaxID=556532 RepID=A0A8J3R0F8_9ACTN|nr:hypothetical protein [Rugosimonospora africana]GIH20223.1 hypothetical protein Raf01_83950 [Rugosimonospora africana]
MLWIYFPPPGRDPGTVINTAGPKIAVIAAYCHGTMIAGTVVEAAAAEL